MKTLVDSSGKMFRMGRLRPRARGLRLRLGSYLLKSLPAPPPVCDYTAKASACLSQIFANDTLGDCTSAGAFHIAGAWLANNGTPASFTELDAIRFYSETTGYVRGEPETDQGADEEQVLNYWVNNGLGTSPAHKAQAWVSINAADPEEVRAAIWLFGNVYFGVSLPDAWVNPMPESNLFTWDVAGAPDDSNGHCFVGLGYGDPGVKIATWGMLGTVTWAAVAKYAARAAEGECYAILGPDWISTATAKAPSGFDILQLASDIASMRA